MSLLEICTETLSGVRAASTGGAQRIELCSALDLDGLTPSEELIAAARADSDLELLVMVRPQPGIFEVDTELLKTMCAQIERVTAMGADGVVCGCLLADGQIDVPTLQELVKAACGLPLTFHRAFDQTPDLLAACEVLIDNGVSRVLTSGGAATAMEGSAMLKQLVSLAGDRFDVVVGGSVREANIAELKKLTGAKQFHSALDRLPTTESVRALLNAC
ncbi:MAG: copper homeostasis protein CutC [Planctomycetes bacterium]|nr:copper homeostasis protein CutC [Planctomycetota bacterium]MCP4771538.1 copper homeostasis protein CutC [Planctomycetota bacterium]MCP4861199.1 copper homeostasis protein CutC [Planctomycetota bacterium]